MEELSARFVMTASAIRRDLALLNGQGPAGPHLRLHDGICLPYSLPMIGAPNRWHLVHHDLAFALQSCESPSSTVSLNIGASKQMGRQQ